jgi:acyl-CoA thioester hydrolase
LIIAQQALLGESLLCSGTIRIGWVDAATLKPARIPPTILEAIER